MKIKLYQVDAFTDVLFGGNPAAVCPLTEWLPDKLMQSIALENNLAETAFYVHEKDGLRIRWFTPAIEVDLCGHATLATAFVLFNKEGFKGETITFNSRSGPLTVTRSGELLTLNFPADVINEVPVTPELTAGFNALPVKAFRGKTDYMLVFENEMQVRNLIPDFRQIGKVKARGVIATARGEKVDFVSRFFGPQAGVDEDSVTGSAHTTLTPYWAGVLKKTKLSAVQCSPRGGTLTCELKGDRVDISGKGKLYLEGTIYVD